MLSRERASVKAGPAGLAGNILWSAAARGIQAATGFVAAVVVARHLSLADLGTYLSALALAGAVLSVSYCGIQQYFVREAGRRGTGEAGALLGAGMLLRLACIVLAGLGLAGWAALTPAGARAGLALVAVACGAEACRSLGQLAGAVFQAHERLRPEGLLALWHGLLWGGLLAVAIAVDAGALGMLVACCLALAGHCLASWIVVARGYVRPRLAAGLAHVGPMLRDSLVIGLSVILVQNLFRINVLVLEWLGGAEAAAFFQTPHDLVLRLQVIFQAVMLAAFPAFSRLFAAGSPQGRAQGEVLVAALDRLAAAGAGGLALGLYLFAGPVLGILYGAKFLPAVPCLRILALATLPLALDLLWANLLIATGRQRQLLVVNAVALGANGLLSLALTGRYGGVGAAIAALAAYTLSLLGAMWAGRGLFAGRLAVLAQGRVLAALAGGLAVGTALPGGWSGPAGLAVYGLLLALLDGAGPRDVRILSRCVRPAACAVSENPPP